MKTLDKGKDLFQQIEIQAAAKMLIDVNNLSANDLNYIKVKLDKMLLSESYTELCYAVFTLESPPPIMGSAIAGPKFDFNGKKLNTYQALLQTCQIIFPSIHLLVMAKGM